MPRAGGCNVSAGSQPRAGTERGWPGYRCRRFSLSATSPRGAGGHPPPSHRPLHAPSSPAGRCRRSAPSREPASRPSRGCRARPRRSPRPTPALSRSTTPSSMNASWVSTIDSASRAHLAPNPPLPIGAARYPRRSQPPPLRAPPRIATMRHHARLARQAAPAAPPAPTEGVRRELPPRH